MQTGKLPDPLASDHPDPKVSPMWLESDYVTQAQAAESNFSLENHPPSWTLRVRCGSVVVPCHAQLHQSYTCFILFHAIFMLFQMLFRIVTDI